MTVYKCEVCRAYRRDGEPHACPGLRTVDWLRFVGSLRDWTTTDNAGRFESYYARRAVGERRRHPSGRSPDGRG
ncbi:MAG TPA: hypothetical protein VK028_04750 [Micromonosporaceae bacterium]|nr:hypothetical protein [Micromonosporaceae bacterium]